MATGVGTILVNSVVDGDTVRIRLDESDVTYELDPTGDGVASGNILVSRSDDADIVSADLAGAIYDNQGDCLDVTGGDGNTIVLTIKPGCNWVALTPSDSDNIMTTLDVDASPTTGYATLAQLAGYLGVSTDALPDNSQRLIYRAGELIEAMCLDNIDLDNDAHTTALWRATCAQVEYWQTAGEQIDSPGRLTSRSYGKVSESYAVASTDGLSELAPRARRFLAHAGLLYRGIGMKAATALPAGWEQIR